VNLKEDQNMDANVVNYEAREGEADLGTGRGRGGKKG